jgi:nucleoid DNA-binding protein
MRIHLHECKATIGLETSFKDIAEVLKEGDQVILGLPTEWIQRQRPSSEVQRELLLHIVLGLRAYIYCHLHECKATIGLETSFKDIAEVLKEGDQVILGGVMKMRPLRSAN